MNAQNRKDLANLIDKLDEVKCDIETMSENEQDKLYSMPEGIQESERGERMQEAIDNLESAASSLEDAIDYLNEAMGE